MERVRVLKQSLGLPGTSQDSVDSTENEPICNTSPESAKVTEMQSSEINSQDQGQRIKEHVERIMDLVRSTEQKVS